MGIRTLDGFRDSVNLVLGEKAQFDERLDRWVNDGIEELFVLLDIEGRRVCGQTLTIADQERYLLPTNLVATLVITDRTNKRRVLKTSIENFERLDPSLRGQPKVFARVDRHIYLNPVPSGEFLLHMFYIKAPTQLAVGTDVSELTSAYDRVIHLLAAKNAMLDMREFEAATFYFQTAQNMLRTIPTEEWLESQTPAEGIEIAQSRQDLTKPPTTLGEGIVLR